MRQNLNEISENFRNIRLMRLHITLKKRIKIEEQKFVSSDQTRNHIHHQNSSFERLKAWTHTRAEPMRLRSLLHPEKIAISVGEETKILVHKKKSHNEH